MGDAGIQIHLEWVRHCEALLSQKTIYTKIVKVHKSCLLRIKSLKSLKWGGARNGLELCWTSNSCSVCCSWLSQRPEEPSRRICFPCLFLCHAISTGRPSTSGFGTGGPPPQVILAGWHGTADPFTGQLNYNMKPWWSWWRHGDMKCFKHVFLFRIKFLNCKAYILYTSYKRIMSYYGFGQLANGPTSPRDMFVDFCLELNNLKIIPQINISLPVSDR